MKNVPENELFSAYLDGELTSEEQAQVERLLAASPAARQLIDELRALSSSLQALPSHRIGEDISAQVLRRAERRMLSEPARAARSPEAVLPRVPRGKLWRTLLRRVARPRTLAWSGVAVAVAVLLMVLNPETTRRPDSGTIVMRTPAEVEVSETTPETTPSIGAASGEAGERLAEKSASAGREHFVVGKIGKRGMPELTAEAPSAPSLLAMPPATAAGSAPAIQEPSGPPSPRGAGGMGGAGFDAGHPPTEGLQFEGKRGKMDAASPGGPARLNGRPPIAPEKAGPADSLAADRPAREAAVQLRRPDREPPETTLVVLCSVTAEALREQRFQGLLDEQEITWTETAERRGGRVDGVSGKVSSSRFEAQAVAAKPLDVIHLDLEATPDQVKALLADLQERPDEFVLLSYASGPSAESLGVQTTQSREQAALQEPVAAPMHRAVQPQAGRGGERKGRWTDLEEWLDAGQASKAGVHHTRRRVETGQAGVALQVLAADSADQRNALNLASPAESPAQEAASEDEELDQERRDRKESGVERSLAEDDLGQSLETPVVEDAQNLETERQEAKQPKPPAGGEQPGRSVLKYRVRFVLQVVEPERPDVAASVVQEPSPHDAAAEAAPPAAAAEAAPAAQAAEAAEVER